MKLLCVCASNTEHTGLEEIHTANRVRMYAPAVTPKHITESNLENQKKKQKKLLNKCQEIFSEHYHFINEYEKILPKEIKYVCNLICQVINRRHRRARQNWSSS